MKPTFQPGRNIAMKVPAHEYQRTLAFYRETLALEELTPAGAEGEHTPRFDFGGKVLKLDLGRDQRNTFAGDALQHFVPSAPFTFLGVEG